MLIVIDILYEYNIYQCCYIYKLLLLKYFTKLFLKFVSTSRKLKSKN